MKRNASGHVVMQPLGQVGPAFHALGDLQLAPSKRRELSMTASTTCRSFLYTGHQFNLGPGNGQRASDWRRAFDEWDPAASAMRVAREGFLAALGAPAALPSHRGPHQKISTPAAPMAMQKSAPIRATENFQPAPDWTWHPEARIQRRKFKSYLPYRELGFNIATPHP